MFFAINLENTKTSTPLFPSPPPIAPSPLFSYSSSSTCFSSHLFMGMIRIDSTIWSTSVEEGERWERALVDRWIDVKVEAYMVKVNRFNVGGRDIGVCDFSILVCRLEILKKIKWKWIKALKPFTFRYH